MAYSLMSRALLRTSREILERNLTVGALCALSSNGSSGIDADNRRQHVAPQMVSFAQRFHTRPPFLQKYKQPSDITEATRQYSKKQQASSKLKEDSDSDSDSDDEFERKRRSLHSKTSLRGDSEFWRRKMRTLHRILDVNRDGVVSFDDFTLLAKRFTDLGHLTPELSAELQQVIRQTWETAFGEISPYNLKTSEQLLTDLHHRLNDPKMAKRIGRFLPYLFKAVDYDHSGHLDLEQYKLFFRCLGLSDEDAAISFAVIDKNGDGQLSLHEFVHLGRQYFLTEDETKISKMFWGPLIDH